MHAFTVTTSTGLEQLLDTEIGGLLPAVATRVSPGKVQFNGQLADAYRLCLWSRLANRVLLQLASGNKTTDDGIYAIAGTVNWSLHLTPEHTFCVDFIGTNRNIKNSQYGALRIKDAIVDQFMDLFEKRPNIDKTTPDVRIQGRLSRDGVGLYLDMVGGSLHQRRYRRRAGLAPIKENIAFAVLMRSGWVDACDKASQPAGEGNWGNLALFDPMCGAGTLLIEAALYATNTAPGIMRDHWGFSRWKGHDAQSWDALLSEARQQRRACGITFIGSDNDAAVIASAQQNAQLAGVAELIQFEVADVVTGDRPAQLQGQTGYIVSNPPYGERLRELSALMPLFKRWGERLKQQFADWHVSLLVSNRDVLRQLRLTASKEYALINGNIDCKLVNYHLHEKNCHTAERPQDQSCEFANRLGKNRNKISKWLKRQAIDCYRLYDADLPNYNAAIDRYGDWVVVQEYAPPKNIPSAKSISRMQDILIAIPEVLSIPPEQIVLKTRKVQKGKAQYQRFDTQAEEIAVRENGAQFWVNLHDYVDTGLFLDHRNTRQIVRQMSAGKRVLNLFAYTGSISVNAALGGAKSVTSVDLSNTYINWAKRNFELNNLSGYYHFVKADCLAWIRQCEAEYDLIIVDPPSFSNSKSMVGAWDVQRDHAGLLQMVAKCLAPQGTIIFSTNLRNFTLSPQVSAANAWSVQEISATTIPFDFQRKRKIHHCWTLAYDG